MSEYHIRYGGYGGIGYYLVSDLNIALFSRFTTCGSWEGHHILDFLQENTSDVQPDTIHADTQGQSAAIFGLAHLLGIQLQPRIRNWKNLHFFRADPGVRYKHIDALFTKQVDWEIIEAMLPEMLRVALSIGAGPNQAVHNYEAARNVFTQEQVVFCFPGVGPRGEDDFPPRVHFQY